MKIFVIGGTGTVLSKAAQSRPSQVELDPQQVVGSKFAS